MDNLESKNKDKFKILLILQCKNSRKNVNKGDWKNKRVKEEFIKLLLEFCQPMALCSSDGFNFSDWLIDSNSMSSHSG